VVVEFRVLQLDSLTTRPGERGNATFVVHERVYPWCAPLLREAALEARNQLLDSARDLRRQVHLLPTPLDRWLKPRPGYL
jgi:hypothetical protein